MSHHSLSEQVELKIKALFYILILAWIASVHHSLLSEAGGKATSVANYLLMQNITISAFTRVLGQYRSI